MTIHKLALFWRSQQARCFTYVHFHATAAPRARAYEILEALAQLSELHLYGAVLDTMPLNVVYERREPPTLITQRLGLKLYPAAPLAPRHGVTYLQFAIPQPIEELCRIDEAKANNFQGDGWQLLQRAVFPYLCLPNGTGAKLGTGHEVIKDVALIELDEEAIEQLRLSPFEPALASTTADLEQTRQQIAQLQSKGEEPPQRDFQRIAKFQDQIAWLTTIQQLEAEAFQALTAATTAPLKAIAVSATALNLSDKISDKKETRMKGKETTKPTAPQPTTETIIAAHQAAPAPVPVPVVYLPERPSPDDELWKDLPQGVFFDSSLWLHRAQLKEIYQIEERSYFRWINGLRQHGLTRYLTAVQDGKVKLFYRPDVERAVIAYNAARPRHRAAASAQAPSSPSYSPTAGAEALGAAPYRATATSSSSTIASSPAPAPAASSSLFERDMRAAIASLSAQQQALAKEMAQLNHQLGQLAAAISSQAAASSNTELMARLVELVTTVASSNATNQKLIALIEQFDGPSISAASTQRLARNTAPALATNTPPAAAPIIHKKKVVKRSSKQLVKKKLGPTSTSITSNKSTLSVTQVARLLNKPPSTVRTWCEVGKLKAKKVDGMWRIDRTTIGKQKK